MQIWQQADIILMTVTGEQPQSAVLKVFCAVHLRVDVNRELRTKLWGGKNCLFYCLFDKNLCQCEKNIFFYTDDVLLNNN
jgi:hypothetical protein